MKNKRSRVRVSQRKRAASARTSRYNSLSRDSVYENIEVRNERLALVRAHLPEAPPPQNRMCASGSKALDRLLGVLGNNSWTFEVREGAA